MQSPTFPQVPPYTGQRLKFPALTRKLHGLELQHLRQHVEDLRARLDAAETERDDALRRAFWAEDNADRWRDDFLQAINDQGATPGLTRAGNVVALPRRSAA
jgi:hypothetical protein